MTAPQPSFRYRIANSSHPLARSAKVALRAVRGVSLPAPRVVVWPLLQIVLGLREAIYFIRRVLWAEPLFKAYCAEYGRRVHTGIFLHYVLGRGTIVLGDDVTIEGKCSFIFAARYRPRPLLKIGSRTGMGHNCTFTIGDSITLGDDCRLSGNITMLDVSGHPTEPEARRRGDPAPPDSVRPIVIGDNVWIGNGVTILPGVTVGDNCVIAAGTVLTASIPANSLVIGNPGRRMASV